MKKENGIKTLNKKELEEYILGQNDKNISRAAIYKRINKLIRSGELVRTGKGLYCFNGKKQYDYSFENNFTYSVAKLLKKSFNDNLEYIIYESIILNEFLNHLIVEPIIIIETPKIYVDDLFWKLSDGGFKNILVNPTDDQRYKYHPQIIIKTMVTKAPIKLKEHKITIEKLMVDVICDNLLNQFYEGKEKSQIIKGMFDEYTVKYDSVKNYAKRRNAYGELLKYIPAEERNNFDDWQRHILGREHQEGL